MSEVVSRVLTKGWRVGSGEWRVGGGGWGVEGEGCRGGEEIDLKMEADHDWSPDTRLPGCLTP